MSRVIQQVHISDTKDLYLTRFDESNNSLTYRSSQEPSEKIVAEGKIEGQQFKIDTYYFSTLYLLKLTK